MKLLALWLWPLLVARILSASDCLLPGHVAPGLQDCIRKGDVLELLSFQSHDLPEFSSRRHQVQAQKVRFLDQQKGFYRIELIAEDATDAQLWVYRSELAVKAKVLREVADDLPAAGEGQWSPTLPDLPVVGDTLEIAGVLLYQKPDLLSEKQYLAASQKLVVMQTENAEGMLLVQPENAASGWLHRGQLDAERRR